MGLAIIGFGASVALLRALLALMSGQAGLRSWIQGVVALLVLGLVGTSVYAHGRRA